MTHFETMIQGGESDGKAILPGNAGESYLVELITPVNGKAEMPRKDEPLSQVEIDLVYPLFDKIDFNLRKGFIFLKLKSILSNSG